MAGAIERAFQDDDEAVFALLKAVYVMSVEEDMRRCVAGCRGDADERAAGPMSLCWLGATIAKSIRNISPTGC
jgi:hypothetical protein